jgi:hypothetical protein
VKITPVAVYLGEELLGSGELAYDDRSAISLAPYTARHCDETPVYVGEAVVPIRLCWDDVVTSHFGSTDTRVLDIPVYLGDSEVGRASIEISDSSGTSLLTLIMLIAVFAIAITPVRSLIVSKRRK